MSDDPLHALARANPFPNDAPIVVPNVTVAARASSRRRPWPQRSIVAASMAVGATLGWGIIATIIAPADSHPNRCVVVGAQVVEANGVCIASPGP